MQTRRTIASSSRRCSPRSRRPSSRTSARVARRRSRMLPRLRPLSRGGASEAASPLIGGGRAPTGAAVCLVIGGRLGVVGIPGSTRPFRPPPRDHRGPSWGEALPRGPAAVLNRGGIVSEIARNPFRVGIMPRRRLGFGPFQMSGRPAVQRLWRAAGRGTSEVRVSGAEIVSRWLVPLHVRPSARCRDRTRPRLLLQSVSSGRAAD
jgi:hypothetical protein